MTLAPKRRWLRFSLLTLAEVIAAVLAIGFSRWASRLAPHNAIQIVAVAACVFMFTCLSAGINWFFGPLFDRKASRPSDG
jgi:hypothetical protein